MDMRSWHILSNAKVNRNSYTVSPQSTENRLQCKSTRRSVLSDGPAWSAVVCG